jgi:hypothetical protein
MDQDALGRADLFPARGGFPPAIADVAEAAADARDVRLMSKAAQFDRLADLGGLERLWCFTLDDERVAAVARCASLRRLYLEEVRTAHLAPLASLRRLEVLGIDGATKVTTLDDLTHLPALRGLAAIHFPKVRTLDPLRALRQLEALSVGGGMWTRMTVESLAPLAALTELRFLDLGNLKASDGSLAPLAALTQLRELDLPNFYPVSELVQLARALPHTKCTWFEGVLEVRSLKCDRCGSSKVMLAGKGARTLCSSCDAERIAAHRALFAR